MSVPGGVKKKPQPNAEPLKQWPFVKSDQEVKVALDVKVVAAGITMQGSPAGVRRVLRASLVLSPKTRSNIEGELTVDLAKWPQEIEDKLLNKTDRMAISVSCLPAGFDPDAGRAGPNDVHRTSKLKIVRRNGDATHIHEITDCWQRVMGARSDENKNPWTGFEAVFSEASKTDTPTVTSDGSNIVSVPRSDMAMFLQAWRARVVLGSLTKASKPRIEPGCNPVADLQQWILNDVDLALLAGESSQAGDGLNSEDVKALKKKIADVFKKRKDYLTADKSSSAVNFLDAFRCSESQCTIPLTIVEPVAKENETAIHAMFQLHQALHDAQLSLDEELKKQIDGAGSPPVPATGIKWSPPVQATKENLSAQIAKRRLYSLQSIPALARVFRFVVDVEIDLGDMDALYSEGEASPAAVVSEGPAGSMVEILARLRPANFHELDTVDTDAVEGVKIPTSYETFPVTHYLFLTSAADGTKQPWTTAKLRYPTGDAWRGKQVGGKGAKTTTVEGHFFPCTREEIDVAAVLLKYPQNAGDADRVACRQCEDKNGKKIDRYILPAVKDGRIVQFDGVLDLGAGRRAKDPAERRPRYDIASLDVVSAMESQMNLARAESARRKEAKRRGLDTTSAVDERPTYRTVGLMLVDRWRAAATAEAAADRLVRQTNRETGMAVFDATALTIGFRIDIGVRSDPQEPHHFRALGNRVVTYTFPPNPSLIEAELKQLGYGKDQASRQRRIRLDSTPVVPGARSTSQHQFPEEILVNWEGDPLGLQCVRSWNGEEVEILVDPAEDLGISRHYELPHDDDDVEYRIPHLLFGKRYRYGLRAQLQGGVTTPIARARAIYEEAAGGMLALPEASIPAPADRPNLEDSARAKGRRFLRHERILSPHVTVPEAEVLAARAKGDTRLRDQSSRLAIVRTATARQDKTDHRLDTSIVRRIFVAPGVSQNFAEMHGTLLSGAAISGTISVVDPSDPKKKPLKIEIERPYDGLRNVAYNYSIGGFPVRSSENQIVSQAPQTAPVEAAQATTAGTQLRDPIFVLQPTKSETHAARALPYFPDPAAESMVFAIRQRRYRSGTDQTDVSEPTSDRLSDYIGGKPVNVQLVHQDLSYPNQLAVLLEVARGKSRSSAASHENILTYVISETGVLTKDGFSPTAINKKTLDSGQVPARRVSATLAPGDDLELDIWCVPSLDQLEKWFDVVESSALLAVARTCLDEAENDSAKFSTSPNLACLNGIEKILGRTDFATFRRRLANWQKRTTGGEECGMGAVPLPTESIRRDIASLIRERMLRRPIPELAATKTLRIAHAVSEPTYSPSFQGREPSEEPVSTNLRNVGLEVLRRNFKNDAARREFVEKNDVSTWHRDFTVSHEPFATDLLVGGDVLADLDSSHSVTVVAEVAHPTTHLFDDQRQGRRRDELGTELNAKHLDQKRPAFTKPDLYGFVVDTRTGQTSFKPQRITLAQLEGLLPSDNIADRRLGTENVNILVDPLRKGMRLDLKRYVPTDDKARRLLLEVEAETRFYDDFEYAPPKIAKAEQARRPTNALDEVKDGIKVWKTSRNSSEGPDNVQEGNSRLKRRVQLWIPSTRRPQPIDPQSILPAFVWSVAPSGDGTFETSRRMIARLRFRRPWFSSGEGEKLGIVLWPPKIFELDASQTSFESKDMGIPDAQIPDEIATIMKDRATGGGYITRAGSDPIRHGGTANRGDFMPLEAFRDAFPKGGRPAKAQRVPNRTSPGHFVMPLPKDPESDQQKQLHVALLTYEPLFDPIDEVWYVDVEVAARGFPDGWIRFGLVRYQEHSIKGYEVSEPTIAMVQILPQRRVFVKTQQQAPDRYLVTLEVEGTGSVEAAPDRDVVSAADESLMQRPVLRPMLLKRTVDLVNRRHEVEVVSSWETKSQDGQPDYVRPSLGDSGLSWSRTFTLKHDPKSTDTISYEIVFDEVDLRPAASPDKDGKWSLVASGPRFAARVPVPGATGNAALRPT